MYLPAAMFRWVRRADRLTGAARLIACLPVGVTLCYLLAELFALTPCILTFEIGISSPHLEESKDNISTLPRIALDHTFVRVYQRQAGLDCGDPEHKRRSGRRNGPSVPRHR